MDVGVNSMPYRSCTRTKKSNRYNLKQKNYHPGEGKGQNHSNVLYTLANEELSLPPTLHLPERSKETR